KASRHQARRANTRQDDDAYRVPAPVLEKLQHLIAVNVLYLQPQFVIVVERQRTCDPNAIHPVDSDSHPPSLSGGGSPVCTGPDFPIQQNPASADCSSFSTSILPIVSVKLETNVKYLIHNCE